MERIAIVAYRPHQDKNEELEKLMLDHWNILNGEGLVSERQPIISKAQDGTFVEVFGWKSKEAIEQAHQNKRVLEMWEAYSRLCDYVPISEVPEAKQIFSEFEPV